MVGKDEEQLDDEGLARVRLITDRKRQLEQTADQVRQEIRDCFERLSEALRGREKQLLRQVEAIHRQQLSLVQSNPELLPGSCRGLGATLAPEPELLEHLRNFGKIELANGIAVNDTEPYKAEEYLEAGEDYVSFDKSLKTEREEFDVSSVIRRKRDSSGNKSRNISINLNCTSCESCKYEKDGTSKIAVATTPKKLDDVPATPKIRPSPSSSSSSSSDSSFNKPSSIKESEESASASPETASPTEASEKAATTHSENFYFENDSRSGNRASSPLERGDDAAKPSATAEDEKATGEQQHPIQIQQWLQQILAETETEPIIHEIGHISKLPGTRLYRDFPVET